MKQSELFSKVVRTAPKDEVSVNAQLLIRAGFIYKEMAGAYAFLPLGLRVLEKVKNIIREEMNAAGGQEIIMTALQRKELWEKTDRWDDAKVDVWFKSELKNGSPVGFGWSHEEPITEMMKLYLSSYRDLPAYVYQFQTKLRNELRAKSGIMRGREFLMKDLYSYSAGETAHQAFYDRMIAAYHRVYERVGLGDKTFLTFASGGSFTQFSHEFQTLCETGEDVIYLDRKKKIGVNKEVYSAEVLKQLGLREADLEEARAAETGNIFSFGSAKSEQLGLYFTDEIGKRRPVILGSYGIGVTRLIGVLVELSHDDRGIVWPDAVAPFRVHLLNIAKQPEAAEKIYQTLQRQGIEVLYDQRNESAGVKFADSDMIGIPLRLLVSDKTLEKESVEVKSRATGETQVIKINDLAKIF